MLQIDDTLISPDIIEESFLCNLAACKGECCVDGDSGAPVEKNEVAVLKEILPEVWDDLLPEAKEVIKMQGVIYIDADGETVTSIVKGKNCVFTCYDENGICKCAIEKAYKEGRIRFLKPVSCHLYPIRVQKYSGFEAVNYHQWSICKPARIAGKENDVKIYRFLREPLIRKFGEDWYNRLEFAAREFLKSKS
ncbi:MAG: DUF3109 family protein [Candidatus Azobacteroides sp.]|nr:DUF3109 family protein [Candidatus Azobacteroides sp.]